MQLFLQFGCLRNYFFARQFATFLETSLSCDERTSSERYLAVIVKRYSKCFRTVQCLKKNTMQCFQKGRGKNRHAKSHCSVAFTGHAPCSVCFGCLLGLFETEENKKLIGGWAYTSTSNSCYAESRFVV